MPTKRSAIRWAAIAGSILGIGYFGVDLQEALVAKRAAEDSATEAIRLAGPDRTAWYVGRWGFRHYASRAGLTQVVPGRTELRPGDVLVVQDNTILAEPVVGFALEDVVEIGGLASIDRLPYRTVPSFYSGKEPFQRRIGPRVVVRIYRVLRSFVPMGWIPPEFGPKDKLLGALRSPPLKN